ncbi:MAG: hypothetical protein Q8M34_00050 [Thermodesulfovibrionales bacterium]|nr:hypothetical protein [Thermodesulfovibrionales bacterium]
MEEHIDNLEFINPNKAWVVKELEKLFAEWAVWQNEVSKIVDQPYDTRRQSEVFADGEENMESHEILQAKTLTFLNNNIKGHGFIKGFDGHSCDRTDLRLKIRVKHRIQQLRILLASLQYANVPESYWKEKSKELVQSIVNKGTDAAIEIATKYLKNPMDIP